MRRCLVALCLLAFVTQTLAFVTQTNAQDFETPTLRGSSPFIPAAPQYTRWAGFYAGGQIGLSSTEMNFAGATEGLIASLLLATALENEHHPSRWSVLGKEYPHGISYGVFIGYNVQFSDVIVGVDFHYNKSDFSATALPTPVTRGVSAGGNGYALTIDGSASMQITDYGAARLRAGWIVNNFLPYGTLGLAVGRANITRSARAFGQENPNVPCGPSPVNNCVAFDFSTIDSKGGHFIYGWAAGAGVDILLMPNFFVRVEFEYMSFTKAQGIQADIGTARAGAAYKF
jgi:outer membrane immunogenic protein